MSGVFIPETLPRLRLYTQRDVCSRSMNEVRAQESGWPGQHWVCGACSSLAGGKGPMVTDGDACVTSPPQEAIQQLDAGLRNTKWRWRPSSESTRTYSMSRWLWTLRSLPTGEGLGPLGGGSPCEFYSEGEALDFKLHSEVACCLRDQKKKKKKFFSYYHEMYTA